MIALKEYVLSDSYPGYVIAAVAFIITIQLLGNRKYPPAIFVIAAGIVYALLVHYDVFSGAKMIQIAGLDLIIHGH